MTTKLLRLATAVALLTGSLCRAAIPPAENLLPGDTLAFLAVPDMTAGRAAITTSPGWMFWNDPAMKPFHDKVMAKWNEQFIAPLEKDLNIKVADYLDLPQGQVTFAVTVNGSNGHDDIPPGLLVLLDAKGKSDSLKTNLAALKKKWTDAGRSLRTETFHGLAFTVVPLSSNDFAGIFPKKTPVQELGKEPKPEKPGEIYFTQFETLLIAGNSPKVVEPVAAHLTGGKAPAIADNPIFAADKLAQLRDNPQYYGWFNGKGFFDLMLSTSSEDGDEPSASPFGKLSPAKVLGPLGFSEVKSATLSFRETREGSTLAIHVSAPESTRAGLLKILAIPPKDASVPQFVPADAVKFSRTRLDGKQAWAEIQKIVAGIAPSGQSSLNAIINMANAVGQQKNPAFDIRNDLFGNLNDDIISYQKPVRGNTLGDLANPPTIYLVSVANPETMINAIKIIVSMSNPQDSSSQPREFQGRKIYTIPLKPAPAAAGKTQPRSVYVSSSAGYVAFSSDVGIIEEFLRSAQGQNKPLRENAGLLSAAQHLGGTGSGVFGYENQRETMRANFKALHDSMAGDDTLKLFPAPYRDWLDFTLLPEFSAVSKFFYISTYSSAANSEGITFKVFAPRPPNLN